MRRALVVGAAAAAMAAGTLGTARAAVPDESAPTPVAKSGSSAAAKDSISRKALRRRLGEELRSAGASSSAYVYDIKANSRRALFSSGGGTRRIPASNEKLFTTAAVISRLGASARLATRVYAHGKLGGRHDQILRGNLVIVGDGDPAVATRGFARRNGLPLTPLAGLARDVRKAGIRKIAGNVRADDHIFDRRRGVGATGWHDSVDLSPLSGLSFNSGWMNGHHAKDPELEAARTLKHTLEKHGVKVRKHVGRAKLTRSALEHDPIGVVHSPTIATLIAETNKPSNNFFAETLLKRLVAKPGHRGTTRRGANRVQAFAHDQGSGIHAVDGSGLGRSNRVSPHEVAKLLTAMSKGPEAKPYRQSLPVAGREGTVANRMRGTAAEGRCRTKTGTLRDVSALSGYCRSGHGLVAFSILMNSVSDFDAAHRAQDHMAALIARYRP